MAKKCPNCRIKLSGNYCDQCKLPPKPKEPKKSK